MKKTIPIIGDLNKKCKSLRFFRRFFVTILGQNRINFVTLKMKIIVIGYLIFHLQLSILFCKSLCIFSFLSKCRSNSINDLNLKFSGKIEFHNSRYKSIFFCTPKVDLQMSFTPVLYMYYTMYYTLYIIYYTMYYTLYIIQ